MKFIKISFFFISSLLISNILNAANLQYFVNQLTYQSLSGVYAYYNYEPSPMMDKAIKELSSYTNVKKCSSSDTSDAIVILNPVLNYQAQSTILYGDLNVKIYQTRSESETNPDNFIKEMKITHWDVLKFDKVTMDFYINKIYKTLLEKLMIEINNLQINSDFPTNGSYCDLLNTVKESKINLRY